MRVLLVCMLLAVMCSFPTAAQDDLPVFDIPYGDGESPRQILDVYLPPDAAPPYPVLFTIHGGGYLFGNKLIVSPFATYFASQGYAVVTPNYRLALAAHYPAPISDIACALAWTHAHADDYGFDLSRLVIVGESAGGNAAALLGTVDSLESYLESCPHPAPPAKWATGIIPYYPIADFSTCEHNCEMVEGTMALYLGVDRYSQDAWGDASPLAAIDGTEPPFLIIHGDSDRLIPFSESVLLAERLEEAGVAVDLHLIEGADHAFISLLNHSAGRAAAEIVTTWLESLFASAQN